MTTDKNDMQASEMSDRMEDRHPTGLPVSELPSGKRIGPAIGARMRRLPWHGIAVVAVLALSAWFRLAHLGASSLTHDEAWRANVSYGIDTGTATMPQRRPPLLFVMGWVTQNVLGRTEFVLRIPCALAGVGCVVLVYAFTRRHLGASSALLVVAVAGAHPALVSLSRSAIVFSLESLMAIALLWVGLEAYHRRSPRWLLAFMVVGLVGLGVTFTSPLFITAWMPLLAAALLWDRPAEGGSWLPRRRSVPSDETGRRAVRCLLIVAAVLTVAGLAWYLWLSSCPVGDGLRDDPMWSRWPASYQPAALGSWLVSRSHAVLCFVLGTSGAWTPLKWWLGVAGFFAVSASVGVLWRRCRPLCWFSAILAVEVIVVGALRIWPIGEFRTVTFLIPLFAIAIGCGLDQFVRRMGRSPATAVILGLCIFVPVARATKATLFPPPLEQHTRPVFAYTAAHLQPDDAIFIHYEMRDAYGFYWRDAGHPILLQSYESRDDLAAFADRFDAWIAEHHRVWFVFMLRRPNEAGPWMEHLKERYHICDEYRFNDAATYLIER